MKKLVLIITTLAAASFTANADVVRDPVTGEMVVTQSAGGTTVYHKQNGARFSCNATHCF
ncbi:hypothetical protein [Vibrio fortis]|uniref:hypothetical protein n=1 Tax=Vibrio fortis TaxID=212667 RepID=UPI003EC01B3E